MKYIEKGNEPLFFSEWKKKDKMYQREKPNWNRLNSDERKKLRNSLIKADYNGFRGGSRTCPQTDPAERAGLSFVPRV